uniref:transcription factor HHO5-like isoform X2 n=1 Tax=Erigeron canadensis TaxID=72917 RepID=UPI001CB8C65A|nr:transcription factor HHO5-like isoform X2 [Erigeron canadensis]
MGNLNLSPEPSLDFRPIFIPKTITMFLEEVSKIGSLREKSLQVDHFVHRLECETRLIEAFKHELPLSMLLINDAIAALKEESMVLKKSSYVEPVLEEFMPIKKCFDNDDDIKIEANIGNHHNDINGDKKNWLSSTHLWNTNENHDHKANSFTQTIKKRNEKEDPSNRAIFNHEITSQMRGSGLFGEVNGKGRLIPFSPPNVQPKNIQIRASIVHAPLKQQTSRKQRRSWSTELHRRFVDALQRLGGSQATPKQIRELMQVDGLTNDEVKSHLQKYRLHTRRHSTSNTSDQNVGSSKCSNSQSGSPDGPLPNGSSNMDDEDDKSENNWWNGS